MKLEFTIPGKPQPKQRARQGRTPSGKSCFYTPNPTRLYEKAVGDNARAAMWRLRMATGDQWPLDARYRLEIDAYFPNARQHDLDNVCKAVSDGMNRSAFADDSQVVELEGRKLIDRENPRTVVRLEVLT